MIMVAGFISATLSVSLPALLSFGCPEPVTEKGNIFTHLTTFSIHNLDLDSEVRARVTSIETDFIDAMKVAYQNDDNIISKFFVSAHEQKFMIYEKWANKQA